MTGGAIDGSVLAGQLESRVGMIERGGLPAVGRVAGRAVRAELSIVRVILDVAGGAILRRALELSVDMAALTGNCGVFAIELECEQGMIDFGETPAFGRVAGCAFGSKLTVVMVVFQVA